LNEEEAKWASAMRGEKLLFLFHGGWVSEKTVCWPNRMKSVFEKAVINSIGNIKAIAGGVVFPSQLSFSFVISHLIVFLI